MRKNVILVSGVIIIIALTSFLVFRFVDLNKNDTPEVPAISFQEEFDLKGGVVLTLKISVEDVIRSNASPSYLNDPVFNRAMSLAKEKEKDSQDNYIDLFYESFQEVNPDGSLVQFFMTPESRDRINFYSTNSEVLSFLTVSVEEAVNNSLKVIEHRLDKARGIRFEIEKSENFGIILLRCSNPEKLDIIKKLISTQGKLEFWTTYNNSEILPLLQEADELLRVITKEVRDEADQVAEAESALSAFAEDEQIIREHPLFKVLTPYMDAEMRPIPGSTIGVAEIKDTAAVNSYLNRPQIQPLFPRDLKFFWHHKPMKNNESFIELHALKTSRSGSSAMTGEYITNAGLSRENQMRKPEVHFRMNAEGSSKWARFTRENAGNQIAITLDGSVITSPNVSGEITGGTAVISGDFSEQEANNLVHVLESGSLKASIDILSLEFMEPEAEKDRDS